MSRLKKTKQEKIQLPGEIVLKDDTEVRVLTRSESWTTRAKALGEYWRANETQLAKIKINTDRNIDEVLDTVLHEILHACFDSYGLTMPAKKEEKIVTELSHGLTDALIHTKGLARFISRSVTAHRKAEKERNKQQNE